MEGQLYQECARSRCDTQPACVECEFCEDHCTCQTPTAGREIQAERNAKRDIAAGFSLIEKYIKEIGEVVIFSPINEVFYDGRPYFTGAGYGAGSVYKIDAAQTICLSIHTGSDVSEWEQRDIILPIEEDNNFDNGNADIVVAVKQLAAGVPLTRHQIRAFAI